MYELCGVRNKLAEAHKVPVEMATVAEVAVTVAVAA